MIDVIHQFVKCDKTDSGELALASHICQEKEHDYYYSIITTPCISRNSIPVHYYNVYKNRFIALMNKYFSTFVNLYFFHLNFLSYGLLQPELAMYTKCMTTLPGPVGT